MSSRIRGLRRPQLSTVIACVAMFAALGGSAYAAKGLIKGSEIKKGTVTSKQIANGTIKDKDLSEKTRKSLQGSKGEQGPQGAQGPQGPQGEAGPQGPAGIVSPQSASGDGGNLPDGVETTVLSKAVGAGTYVVNAKANLFGAAGVTRIDCVLLSGASTVDQVSWSPPAANTRAPVPMQALVTSPGSTLQIHCTSTGGTGSATELKLAAIPVS